MTADLVTWWVVADAARARILAYEGPTLWRPVATLVHPESRMRGAALAAMGSGDRPGHVEGTGHALGSASYVPHETPKEHAEQAFAREVAAAIGDGIAAGQAGALVLVSGPRFLGLLRAALDARSEAALRQSLCLDLAHLPEPDLLKRLEREAAAAD